MCLTAAFTAFARAVGPVALLFNAACFVRPGTVLDCSEDAWDFSFDLNVKSMPRPVRAMLPGMLARASALATERGATTTGATSDDVLVALAKAEWLASGSRIDTL